MKRKPIQFTADMLPIVSGSGHKLYQALHLLIDSNGVVEASLDELAEKTGLTARTIQTVRLELYNLKLLVFGQTTAGSTAGRGYRTIYQMWTTAIETAVEKTMGSSLSGRSGRAVPQHVAKTSSKGGKDFHKGGKNFVPQKNLPPFFTYIDISNTPSDSKKEIIKKDKKKSQDEETPALPSPGEELVLLERAAGIIGVIIKQKSANVLRIKSSLRARLKEGYSQDDLVNVCHYAAKEWNSGVHFRQLKDLTYIWTRGFESLLATKGESGIKTKGKAPVFREGEELEKWKEEIRRREES